MKKYLLPILLMSSLYACPINLQNNVDNNNNSSSAENIIDLRNNNANDTNSSTSKDSSIKVKISFKNNQFPPENLIGITDKITFDVETSTGKYSGVFNSTEKSKVFYIPEGKIKIILNAYDKNGILVAKIEKDYTVDLYSQSVKELSFDKLAPSTPNPTPLFTPGTDIPFSVPTPSPIPSPTVTPTSSPIPSPTVTPTSSPIPSPTATPSISSGGSFGSTPGLVTPSGDGDIPDTNSVEIEIEIIESDSTTTG